MLTSGVQAGLLRGAAASSIPDVRVPEERNLFQRRSTMTEKARPRRLLFVCTANQHRSRTAEDLYRSDPRYEVQSAGTHTYADNPEERQVTREMVEWADVILVMEERHRSALAERFSECRPRIVVLNIPDWYYRGDPRLVQILRRRLSECLCSEKDFESLT
jgi:predicted protein tyrosine phosphatase